MKGHIFGPPEGGISSGDDTDDEEDDLVGGLVYSKRENGLCWWCWNQLRCTACKEPDENKHHENESVAEEVVISKDGEHK